jgi:hypothetical protein
MHHDKFKEAENEDNNNNVYIQRMRKMEVREGKGKRSILRGKLKRAYNQLIDWYNECSYSDC